MTTQKQIKEWIPEAQEIFNRFMPLSVSPEIHIVTDRTVFKTRADIVSRLHSKQTNIDEENYTSIMETIHGEKGDAILIQQKYIQDSKENPYAEVYFRRFLWHEYGHCYAAHYENTTEKFVYFYNPGLAKERAKQEGYWMWAEFIAEAIALYVDEQHCRIDNKEFYHPELMTWEPEQWMGFAGKLSDYLTMTFCNFPMTIDEAALSMYFASLLMEDGTKRYVKAAEEGKLRIYDKQLLISKPMEPGSIEPTCISEQPETFQETLWQMKYILEKQVSKKAFWEIDSEFLEEIGQCVVDLMNKKVAMIAARC